MNITDRMQQGDHYAIPFELTFDGKMIVESTTTPDSEFVPKEVQIQVGPYLKSSSSDFPIEERLFFSPTTKTWNFFITEEQTRSLPTKTEWQFAVKDDSDQCYYSVVDAINIGKSIIKTDWVQ